MNKALKADFSNAFDSASSDDDAEINQPKEEYDLSDPERPNIKPLTAAGRLEVFYRLIKGMV